MALARYAGTVTARCGFVYSGFALKHLNLSKNGKSDNAGHLLKIITTLTVG